MGKGGNQSCSLAYVPGGRCPQSKGVPQHLAGATLEQSPAPSTAPEPGGMEPQGAKEIRTGTITPLRAIRQYFSSQINKITKKKPPSATKKKKKQRMTKNIQSCCDCDTFTRPGCREGAMLRSPLRPCTGWRGGGGFSPAPCPRSEPPQGGQAEGCRAGTVSLLPLEGTGLPKSTPRPSAGCWGVCVGGEV